MRLFVTKLFPAVLILIFFHSASAQNIVPNNGFENYSSLPNGYGQWYKLTGWSNLNGYIGFVWPYASPDFLHSSGGAGVDIPFNTFATVNAFAGNAILGFTVWHGTTPAFREYAAIQFSTPMIAGETYDVSMWITNGSAAWYCGAGCNHIGMGFSMSLPYQMDHEPIGGIPQCEYAGEIWNTGWQFISFTYTADQAYNYLTIGNFYDDLSTSHTTHAAFAMSNAAYYFIDEVVVMPAAALAVSLENFYAQEKGNDVNLYWNTKSEINNDYFVIERSNDGHLFEQIGMQDAAGYSTELKSYAFSDKNPVNGVNYYRLASVDFNGEITYSDIVEITLQDLHDQISIGPNPCGAFMEVQLNSEEDFTISIFNVQGATLYYAEDLQGSVEINTGQFVPGIYFVQVNYRDTSFVRKIIIR